MHMSLYAANSANLEEMRKILEPELEKLIKKTIEPKQ